MLTHLRIQQMAIVAELEVDFGPGFNVITGETGAGKSILVNALKLVLGARARPEWVRTGAAQAEVEALFEVRDNPALLARLGTSGLASGDEVLIRRVIQANGRSKAYVNGQLTTTTQLSEIALGLVDISSQHEHQTLVDAASHLGFLDAFAGLAESSRAMEGAYAALVTERDALRDERVRFASRAEREDWLRFQLAEIDKVGPAAGEDVAIETELFRLRHSEKRAQALRRLVDALDGGEEPATVLLAKAVHEAREVARFDAEFDPVAGRIDALLVEIRELVREVRRFDRGGGFDASRLSELEERMHQLRRLMRRHEGRLDEVIAARERLAEEVAALEGGGDRIVELEGRVFALTARAGQLARELSEGRRAAAERLGGAITAELDTLGMGGARVEIQVDHVEAGDADLAIERCRLLPTGIDRVEFLIAPNRGEDPRPLGRVASGGELSRALLALKRVLAGLGPIGTYVFDEVDSGVGGVVAETIGRKLAEVARHHQVICITHLPQVACLGDRHFAVQKSESEGRTYSSVRALSVTEREEEVARMLGGAKVTEAVREAARTLLAR